ncbi:hypothetical protein [Litoribacillus peritrichatus]|uniref:Lipoprotein n=1 Tax=Litoribacillus peritrichatus TaxID=718191 RepID=A0ABP7NEZ6_9GAMM
MMKLTLLIFVLILSGCSNDFNTICTYYDELSKHPSIDSLSPKERYNLISKKVDDLDDSNAKAIWSVLGTAAADEQYEIFQRAAVETDGGSDWECPTMEALMSISIKNKTADSNLKEELDHLNVTTMENADFSYRKRTVPIL